MRLGLIARADKTGLGYQTHDYYKFLKPDKTVVIDLSPLNGNPQHTQWYQDYNLIKGIPDDDQVRNMLSGLDVILTAETPYNLNLYKIAREMGVKTICVENPEFYDHVKYPQYEMPDMIILPSTWKEDYIREHAESRGTKVVQLHHPVDRDTYEYRERTTTKTMHIAGKPAENDRNGTWLYMNSQPKGIVTTQSSDFAWHIRRKYRHSNVFDNVQNQLQLYSFGDILVLPRKYGGNCLPLNEALSSGMPVIMPNISPNNHLLPKEWLVDARVVGYFEPRGRVDIYEVDPDDLHRKITYVQENIKAESQRANAIADSISWTTLLPRWQEAIKSLL